ncbi:outer membrane protein assembly factor BamB family protein [Nannocystis punicea]|uniref:PQQ-binding-like beta-propeller repeat protein n=1 Tax=Nannocystis punicea TaxID=2995304 RepID=A0ABY7GT05_9BACT|nr:PQQ-binding-like beta-propeller repeat protein [Nannocystis poenicansa]WAS90081.1 PQQ-binding-like beta-propeller repeat protein [Nannocystis poenicansa]
MSTVRYFDELTPFTRRREPVVLADCVLVTGGCSVGAGRDILFCLERTSGKVRWEYPPPWKYAPRLSQAVHTGGLVFVVDSIHRVHALDLATGAVRWQSAYRAEPGSFDHFLAGDPCVVGDTVVFGDSLGWLRAFWRYTGEARKEQHFDRSLLAVQHDRDDLWLSGQEGLVAALDPHTLAPRWLAPLPRPLAWPLVTTRDHVVARSEDHELFALARRDGRLAWRLDAIACTAELAWRGASLFAVTTAGELCRIDAATGQREICLRGQIPQIVGKPAVDDDFVYVETAQGLMKLAPAEAHVSLWHRCFPTHKPATLVCEGDELVVYRERGLRGYCARIVRGQQVWEARVGDYGLT